MKAMRLHRHTSLIQFDEPFELEDMDDAAVTAAVPLTVAARLKEAVMLRVYRSRLARASGVPLTLLVSRSARTAARNRFGFILARPTERPVPPFLVVFPPI